MRRTHREPDGEPDADEAGDKQHDEHCPMTVPQPPAQQVGGKTRQAASIMNTLLHDCAT